MAVRTFELVPHKPAPGNVALAPETIGPEAIDQMLTVMRQLAGEGMTTAVVTHEMTFARPWPIGWWRSRGARVVARTVGRTVSVWAGRRADQVQRRGVGRRARLAGPGKAGKIILYKRRRRPGAAAATQKAERKEVKP